MLFIVLRKLWNSKWMIACLLIGSILAVAIISSIPMYTNGILQRMLVKDMEQYQIKTNNYPGNYYNRMVIYSSYDTKAKGINAYNWFMNKFENEMIPELNVPLIDRSIKLSMDYWSMMPLVPRENKPRERYMGVIGITDYEDHITITQGRMPSKQIEDGVIEVLLTEKGAHEGHLLIDEVLTSDEKTGQILDDEPDSKPILFKIVGFYEPSNTSDLWWAHDLSDYSNELIMDDALFRSFFIKQHSSITSIEWLYSLDYTQIDIDSLDYFLGKLDEHEIYLDKYMGVLTEFGVRDMLTTYSAREKQLTLTLWVLQVPLMIMLAFYLFMVSQLIVENEKNEIAILRSRGSSKSQIFISYLIQSTILSSISMVLGPFLGLGICKVLGASNGFLDFVSRTALPVSFRTEAVVYAIVAGIFSTIMMMIPVVQASKTTIINLKQEKGRKTNAAFWKKIFLDVILMGIAIYGLNSYQNRQEILEATQASGIDIPVDPQLFIISTLFILGAGLLFLRIYPYLVRILYWLGKRVWPPTMYASFVQVGRSGGREVFLMLFIILTLSIGVFSANSARTINQNIEDKAYYKGGADITVQYAWKSNKPRPTQNAMTGMFEDSGDEPDILMYEEMPFSEVNDIAGTAAATKVLNVEKVTIKGEGMVSPVVGHIMGIDTKEFSEVAWSREDLLDYHINIYLNLLSASPNAVLISKDFADEHGLSVGSSVQVTWDYVNNVQGIVHGIVEYWPSLNPKLRNTENFVIANLSYIQASTRLLPYEVWYKKADGATSQTIYDDIEEKNLRLVWIEDATVEVVKQKNDPLLLGTNGAMTMSFVVTMMISFIGFIIYWLLSIQSRVLQFGIFRAMGMSKSHVIFMLIFEQILISVTAVFAGIIIGGIASDLFVPLLQMVNSTADQVPPFTIVASRADYLKIYTIVGTMLLTGFVILGIKISNVKMAQAIKLGED